MTDYSSEDFWRGAPADAQAFMPGSYQWIDGWWKKKGDQFYFWPFSLGESGGWAPSYARPFDHPNVVMRPAPQWSGDGLPPVGTVFEYFAKTEQRWIPVVMIGVFRNSPVLGCIETAVVGQLDLECYQLRPRRTTAQIAAEERDAAVLGMLCHDALGASRRGLAEALYDAGYRLTKGDDK